MIDRTFPGLLRTGYSISSEATSIYNCFAWAAGEDHRWWEPDAFGIYYWPTGAPRVLSLQAFEAAYGTIGYVRCEEGTFEEGFEKVAIYANGQEPTHAARQLQGGRWTSKLGDSADIEHSLDGLEGQAYGTAVVFMKRKL